MFEIASYRGSYRVRFGSAAEPAVRADAVLIGDRRVVGPILDLPVAAGRDLLLDAGEQTKELAACERLLAHLVAIGFRRGQRLLCVGGGTLQDLVAFTAAILYRGVRWDFVPTTLLAQCDSCIGSKTSINFGGYKNLLGGFHPPGEVVIDTALLRHLPASEIRSGIGEMLHYLLLEHHFDTAERLVAEPDPAAAARPYIEACLAIKRAMIERDEFDQGERNLFNYGHTFGHAIEVESGHAVNHGQAVTLGMGIANRISLARGLIGRELHDRVAAILARNLPDYRVTDRERFLACLRRDKKNTDDLLTCILLDEHRAVKARVTYDEVLAAL